MLQGVVFPRVCVYAHHRDRAHFHMAAGTSKTHKTSCVLAQALLWQPPASHAWAPHVVPAWHRTASRTPSNCFNVLLRQLSWVLRKLLCFLCANVLHAGITDVYYVRDKTYQLGLCMQAQSLHDTCLQHADHAPCLNTLIHSHCSS